MHVEQFTRGFAWLDTGTYESLLQAANFVQTLEARQGLQIACLEEIAFHRNWIDAKQLAELASNQPAESKAYLTTILENALI